MKRWLTCGIALLTLNVCEHIAAAERPELSTLIAEALKAGHKKIDIPKGRYALSLENGKPMMFENLRDMEINGNGSDVLCRIPSQIMAIRNCENLTIKGFSFDTQELPFTQGTVVACDTEKGVWLDVQIHDGYEAERVVTERVQVFDPRTKHLKKNLWTLGGERLERLAAGRWRLHFPREDKNRKIAIGDLMVLGVTPSERLWTHTIILDDSRNCTLEAITLYFSNCFSFLEHGCHGNRYLRCKLIKNENDAVRGFPRLRSGNADALHSKFATLGPRVEGCEFRDHGDDCVAINGNFYIVVAAEANRVLIFERHGHKFRIEAGDPVRFTRFDGTVLGDAKVVSLTRKDDADKAAVTAAVEKYHLHGGNALPPHYRVYELTLDAPVAAAGGDNVYALNRIGNGYVVRNNTMGYTRARGVLVKAGNGEISGNTIVGCELGAIIVSPELYWLEAGYTENLVIKNNRIRDCFFHHNRWGDSQPAAISVIATTAKGDIMSAGTLRNIDVLDNTVSGSPFPALVMASVKGGTVRGNRFEPPVEIEQRQHGKRYAERHGFRYDDACWLLNNEDVMIEK